MSLAESKEISLSLVVLLVFLLDQKLKFNIAELLPLDFSSLCFSSTRAFDKNAQASIIVEKGK